MSTRYHRLPERFDEFTLTRGDGSALASSNGSPDSLAAPLAERPDRPFSQFDPNKLT